MPPHTTKRRTTKNLKTKSNQNYPKIKLYGIPTTKELTKKYSDRLVGGAETAAGAQRKLSKAVSGRLAVPRLWAEKPGGTTGEQDRPCKPGFQCREIKPQNL